MDAPESGMRAAMVDGPDGTVVVRRVTEPPLGPYDCRCEMLFGTVCAGTDQHILHDRLPWRMEYPLILGHESVGRVVAVGEKARYFRVGDVVARVGAAPDPTGKWHLGWGGFAEYGFARDWQAMEEDGLPASEWRPYRIHQVIPHDIPAEVGPLFITLRETLSYSTRLGVTSSSRLLVVGSGGNALAFVHHAHVAKAFTIAVLGSAAREKEFRAAGATDYADYRNPDILASLASAFPDGFDYLIDTVGQENSLDSVLPLLADGGTIGVYGLDEWERLTIRPARARGTFTLYQGGYDEPESHAEIIARFSYGEIDADLWFGPGRPTYPLERIGDAFAAIARREVIKPLIALQEQPAPSPLPSHVEPR